MKTKAAAFYDFFSSFGMKAYEENSVPSNEDGGPEFPYITYELITDEFGDEVPITFSTWHRSESWIEANAKAEEISERIGRGGIFLDCKGGAIWIKRGSPFATRRGDDSDDLVKRVYFNISVEFWTEG